MKIVHVVESFAGGVYDFLVSLTGSLTEYQHVIIYSMREYTPPNFKKDFPEGTKFVRWKGATREINPLKDLIALVNLMWLLKVTKGIDVIHLHSSKAGFLGRLSARILGLSYKVIYTTHGVSFLRQDVSLWTRKQFIYLEKLAHKFGGKIITCSRSECAEFRKYGMEADYIYNGIDCNLISGECVSKREDVIVVGTMGRITYQKGPQLYNKIATHFLTYPKVKFLWIGDGDLKKELIAENIEVTGWLCEGESIQQLERVDIYLSTSLWEGLPLSVLKAMCLCKPLILSDCVGNRDLVLPYFNGYLFSNIEEAVKSLIDLINDPVKRKKWGENSKQIVIQKFSLSKMVFRYKTLYEGLLSLC